MGVSVDSVNSQFQRIKARLTCPTRKAAARRAAESGLI
jgi:DNA-binding CsgD family transcriptional regulator